MLLVSRRLHSVRSIILASCTLMVIAGLSSQLKSDDKITSPPNAKENAQPAKFVENPFLPPGVDDAGWPFLRGPNYDGKSAEINLAESWSEEGYPVLWNRKLGQGFSGFVSAANRIYTQYQAVSGQFVVCLNAETGETVWEYRYDWPYEAMGVYPGPRSTPTVQGERVYFSAPSGLVGCLNSADGKLIWSVNLKEKFSGKGTDFGCASTPTIVEDKVIIPVGGKGASLVALNVKDGAIVWKAGDDPASYTPVLPIEFEEQKLVVGYLENTLVGHNLKTGELLWRLYFSQGYDEHAAWPIYSEPYLWISGPFRSGSQLFKLTNSKEEPVKTIWKKKQLSNDVCSTVLYKGHLYGFDLKDIQAKVHRPSRGTFRCLNFQTGEQVWETDKIGQASLLIADDKLILFNDSGELIIARATSEKYDELARHSVLGGEICWSPPTLHRGRLFLRNHSQAVCIYLGKPELLHSTKSSQLTTTNDLPQSKYLDLTMLLGVEPEYAFDVPSREWYLNWYTHSLLFAFFPAFVVATLFSLLVKQQARLPVQQWVFWLLVFVAGMAGTTGISLWKNEFIFTWPVCLFIAFQITISRVKSRQESESRLSRWLSRVIALSFLLICVGYYLLCHRLSLVFEWSFLTGFPAAFPFSFAAMRLSAKVKWRWLVEFILTILAFTVFYWSSVIILSWKY